MATKVSTCLIAASALSALLLVCTPHQPAIGGGLGMQLAADPRDPLADSDNDMLPDDVEWAVLTNHQQADTDNDGHSDFIEVVTHGQPRRPSGPIVQDHEMRVVVTSVPNSQGEQTWLHLMFRLMGEPSLMTSFQPWIHVPGYPLMSLDILSAGSIHMRSREVAGEGRWYVLSLPITSTEVLQHLLPCTLGADATIGGRAIRTGTKLFDLRGTIATMVPSGSRFAVQSIAAVRPFAGGGSNKICLLELNEAGDSPQGTIYQVVDAECDDCNDLECGVSCPETVGWTFVLPGGVTTITGG